MSRLILYFKINGIFDTIGEGLQMYEVVTYDRPSNMEVWLY